MSAVVCIFFLLLTSIVLLPFIFWSKTKDSNKLFFIAMHLLSDKFFIIMYLTSQV